MNRNVSIVIVILVLVVIAGYLVWLRSRYQPPVTALPESSASPEVMVSPSPSLEVSASPSAKPKSATSGATVR